MFSLLRLRLSLLLLGSDEPRPTYRSLSPRFFFSPWWPPLQPFRRTTVTVKTNWNLTLPHKWPRVPSDASKRSYEKTLHCCRIPLTLRIKCLGVSGSFLNRTVMLLFCCQLCYTNWHSNLSCFRKFDVTRYHKCSTFSRTGRAISRIGHTPFDVILLCSTCQRVVSTVRPCPFFWHHNANDSLLNSLLAFTQFNYLMSCSAFVLLLPLSFSI